MKNFSIGIIIGIFGFLTFGDIVSIINDGLENKTLSKIERFYIFPGIGLKDPLTGRCTKEIRQAPGGPKIVMREYFQCNSIQNKISDLINNS